MAKQYRVKVLAEDFADGIPNDSNRCAVKRAISREIPGARRVEVDLQTVRFSLDGERHVFLTPWRVSEYVIAFDAGDEELMLPFEFVLRPSQQVGSKVRRQAFTEEGQKIDRARNRIRKLNAKRAKVLETADDPNATPAQQHQAGATIAMIDEQIDQLEQDYAEVRAQVKASGKPRTLVVHSDAPKAPRLAKTRTRKFGQRQYRVNQAEGRVHYTSA